MAEFFISPDSQRAIDRERMRREQRFTQARTQARQNPVLAERMVAAHRINPTASNELKQAYALSPQMTDDQFLALTQREAERKPDTHDGGFMGRVGDVLHKTGMGIWDQLVKPAVRGAFLAVDTAAEELVQRPLTSLLAAGPGGPDVSFREAYRDYGDSAGLNLLQGDFDRNDPEGVLGHGFFAGGAAAAEAQSERVLEFGGQQAAFGRGIAHGLLGEFYTPGDKAYDITAGVAQFIGDVALDPTAWATMGATKAIAASKGLSGVRTLGQARRGISIERANEAARQLDEFGLVSTGERNTVIFEQAKRVLGDPQVLDEIASADAYTIFRRMKLDRLGARGDDLADLVTRLGDETDPNEIGRILIEAAQAGHVRERGFYKGAGRFIPNLKEEFRNIRLDKNLPEFRYGGVNPSRVVSATNRTQAATDIDGLLRLGKVGEADRASIVSRALKATNNDEMLHIVDDTVRAIGRKMEDVGVSPDDVEELISAHHDSINKMTSYLLDDAGRPSPAPWKGKRTARIHGVDEEIEIPSAALLSHLNKQAIPLPDPTDIRRATTKMTGLRKVYESNGWEMGVGAARFANKYLFKFPTLFTRLAYPLRNNLDNQARAAAAGYHSAFTNPVAWFSLGVRNPEKFRDIVIDGATGNAKSFDEVAREIGALTQDAAGMWADDGAKAIGAYRTYTNGVDKEFVTAWRSELGKFVNDGIAPLVADTNRWLDRDQLIDHIIDNGLVDELARFGDEAKNFFYKGGTGIDRQAVDTYLGYVDEHIDRLTGGDTGLRRLIATGDLNGTRFNDLTQNKRINQILREQYLETAAPKYVSGDTFIAEGSRSKSLWKRKMDQWVDLMASQPENKFTRYPLLAQVFADDLARAMPSLADDTLRQQLVKAAADAGFDDKLFGQIAQAAQKASGQRGILDNVQDVVDASKLHATDQMLDIAFDATTRSSFQEMADVIFPFWDAFAEVGQSWGRILRDNPAAFSRGTAVIQSARGSGLIYVNEHDEEVFAFPGGGMLAKMLGVNGGSIRLEGRLEGLNLVTQGFGPGFGPMVQWATGAFLPDTPDLQWARDILTPFGTSVESPSDLGNLGGLINDLTPAWMEKTLNNWADGEIDPVAWNSAVGDALKVLATTGDYDPADPDSQRRLVQDAEKAARWTTYLRSALQMGAPTGPSVAWEVKSDPDGVYHRVNVMASAYYDLLQNSDQETATATFIETYGVEPFWIAQGKTRELREGPRTREGYNWIGRHREAAERHPDVIGYFVPVEDTSVAASDYGVYKARLAAGDIESLKPEEQLALANKTKARAIYYAWKDRVADLPSGQRTRMERLMRDSLEQSFPGWQADVLGVSSKLDRDSRIRLLRDAVEDPSLQDSPVTEPLRAYLTARDRAFTAIQSRGGATTLGAQANADLKDWLYSIGQQIVTADPNFQGVWQTVLSSEVE